MSRPSLREDRQLNEAMGRAAVAGDMLVGGLPDVAAILAERERTIREKALERAEKAHVLAYPVLGFGEGWFAVPSQTELGHVYLVHLNVRTGDVNTCTCPNPQKWCTHSGAARNFYDAARNIDDAERQAAASLHLLEIQGEHDDTER